MTAVKSKHSQIAERVLQVLEDFPDAGDRQVFLEVYLAFTVGNVSSPARGKSMGVGNTRTKEPSSDKSQKRKNDKSGSSANRRNPVSPSGLDSKGSSSVDSEVIEKGKEFVDVKSSKTSPIPLLKAVVSDHSVAKRQPGAAKPRMDHKSIKARVAGARKSCRRALSSWKENWNGERSKLDAVVLGKARDLVNSVKSFRLIFHDAYTAQLPEVNIGIDLYSGFISIGDYEWISEQLEQSGLLRNEANLFWEDPNGVLATSLSDGDHLTVNSNPFS